ncbi:MAG: HD-GYP domain-containing protein [Gemmatimonadota bacterium]|nr:HD-GYP domain-containing protein [Gemmatimonadota bacterium]
MIGLAGLVVVALLSESLAIGIGTSAGGNSSITFLPLLASVQLFGPAGGIVLAVSTLSFVEFVVRRKPFDRAAFNVSQCVVATSLAGSAFVLLGGQPIEGVTDPDMTGQLWPFLSFGLLFLAMNHAAVALAITLSQGMPFRKVWQKALDSTASLNDLLISPIALAIAFLYVQFGIPGIVVVLLPMLFIRYSYLTTSKLRESNSDLLTVLVKAIEIRDPYTSGHSVRVSKLARELAEELGLNRITVDRVTNAALLHDIGKIEAVYTDILRKPDSLTEQERAIIESHVTRGEQLLRDLSSVPEEVVRIVRHHHEREDGAGYPDGLMAEEIPIGSKIIVVCDAVDAMLSDRPYRDALSLSVVLEQLQEHAGRQFDHRVVKALVNTDILAAYAETMRAARQEQSAERTLDIIPHAPSMNEPMTRPIPSSAQYH